eukprot:PhM_4_TR7255/c0_g10_i1/m.95237
MSIPILMLEQFYKAFNHRLPMGSRGTWRMSDFLNATNKEVYITCFSFKHPERKTLVTLVPMVHVGHPSFYHEVDLMCAQHESVLMEGKNGNTLTPILSIPPRDPILLTKHKDYSDSEGWEPEDPDDFRQLYSWGVAGSKCNTVIHAADLYDYECLPMWAK